jgi:large subunit ribosomal protein L22
MEVKAVYKYARMSPQKVREVAREIQGLPVADALSILNYTPKKSAMLLGKTLQSAIANAEENNQLDGEPVRQTRRS